jgi:restriction system protein
MANRVHWARTYLKQAGLLDAPRRGVFVASEAGRAVLADPPGRIGAAFLERFEAFRAFKERRVATDGTRDTARGPNASAAASAPDPLTPDEMLRLGSRTLHDELATTLLGRVREATPIFFEKLVVNLLLAMGYGGTTASVEGSLTKTSGDGGIDGVIDQDPLGLDRVYVQAKRYAEGNSVGAPAIRGFFGSLDRFKAAKSVFLTTSTFTRDAMEEAAQMSKRIVLIDGDRLARLMIRYEVGCRTVETVAIKREDEDFFET